MMKRIMNERAYAESILNGRDLGQNPAYTTGVLAKYYKALGYRREQIRAEIERLLIERVPKYTIQTRRTWIKRALDVADKYPLLEIGNIVITKPEISRINAVHSKYIKDPRLHRFAFTVLCYAKYEAAKGGKDGWINCDWRLLFDSGDLKGYTKAKQDLFFRELCSAGLIRVPLFNKGDGIQVLFLEDGELAITVSDINEAGKIFQEYTGRRYVRCQDCGTMVPVTNGHTRRCKKCAAIHNREKSAERMRRKKILEKQV